MILSWNTPEMPASTGTLDCSGIAVDFCDKMGNYLGPVAWFNPDTGHYTVRVRDEAGNPVVVDDRYVYEDRWINPDEVRVFLRAVNGDHLVELTMEYVKNVAVMLRDGKQNLVGVA